MSYRCTNAFIFADQVFPGGMEVDDNHPILKTHAASFVRVGEPARATETASAPPGVPRAVPTPPESLAPEPVQELPKKRGRPKKQASTPATAPVEPEGSE